MNTITKEWLHSQISAIKAVGITDSNTLQAFEIALASLEAEAVGEVFLGKHDDCGCHPDARVVCIAADGQADWESFKDGTRLYTAPPAPVSVADEVLKRLLPDAEKAEFWFEHNGKILFEGVKFNNAVFEACRAAMLHGAENAESTSGNSPVIPDGWKLVPIEPTEHMIVEGFESEPDEFFSDAEVWEAYDAMTGCQQAAHRAKLCWAAMLAAAPKPEA